MQTLNCKSTLTWHVVALLVGKERDKVRKTSKRASKTREQTLHR